MKTHSRTMKSVANMVVGVGCQALSLVFTFICRTVFIAILGAEYLGINGLYSSILIVLSLAELGIANVMIYSLYKPIKENDEEAICSLLNYYKGVYRKIAATVLILGLCIVPLLPVIIESDLAYKDLIIYYLMFLMNSVVSYFVSYKVSLINADQKNYIFTSVSTACTLITNIVQIIVLLVSKSFILYLLIMVIGTLMNNLILSRKANKLYPYIQKKNTIANSQRQEIKESIKAMFFLKIGNVIMNNTDNILISIMIGTIFVGYYSNYALIVSVISTFIAILIQSMQSSIGNLNAENDIQKSYRLFNLLILFFHWLSAVCSLCFLVVFNDFITIWIGEQFLLEMNVVIAIVFNFYIKIVVTPVWIYRETFGLFNQIKYIMFCAAILNLIFSIVLGTYWGLAGIILSTALARLLTNVWVEPKLLFNRTFQQPVSNYWYKQLKHFLTTIIGIAVTIALTISMPVSMPFIIAKIFISIIVMSMAFLLSNLKGEELGMINQYMSSFKKLARLRVS